MKRTNEHLQDLRKLIVHENMGPLYPAAALIRMVLEATEHTGWTSAPTKQGATPAPVLRSILTFCYATGIYSSIDIEAAVRYDPAVRYLSANHRPSWESIRDFRRKNMSGLRMALSRLLVCALPDSTEKDCSEAGRRLARAIQADSCALDI